MLGTTTASIGSSLGLPLLLAIVGGALVYFGITWVGEAKRFKKLAQVDLINSRIDEEERKREKQNNTTSQRLRRYARKQGYRGDLTPLIALAGFSYLFLAVALRLVGFNGVAGFVAAVPVAFLAAFAGVSFAATKRRKQFNRQLLQMLSLLATAIESGVGPRSALDRVVSNLQEPLKSEMTGALNTTVAQNSLVTAMKELAEKYPSRAFTMFISALEIDEAQGGRIEPALRQAGEILQRDFDLASEASAEISQVRSEFFAIVTIITLITLTMYTSSDSTTREAYFSPVGIIVLLAAFANFGLGMFRAFRIFARAKGDV